MKLKVSILILLLSSVFIVNADYNKPTDPCRIPGGICPNKDHNDEQVQLFLTEAVAEINQREEPDYKIKRIIESSKQVVSGILVRIKAEFEIEGKDVICDFEVWEQAWITNGRQVDVNCNNNKLYNFKQNPVNQRTQRARRAISDNNRIRIPTDPCMLPGGICPIENNDSEELKLFLTEAVDHINVNEEPDYIVKNIIESSRQVVSGILYRMKVEFDKGESSVICDFKIWEQSWIQNGREVTVNCNNNKLYSFKQNPVHLRVRRDSNNKVGDSRPISNDDETVNNLLKNHLSRLDTGSDSPLELVSIEKVTKQVVAGIKYKILGTFKAGDEEKRCNVEIWHRAWIKGDEGVQLEADCNDGLTLKTKTIRKRSTLHHRRPLHDDNHHHHLDRHHHYSTAVEEMKEVKSEILFDEFVKKFNRKYVNNLEHKMRMKIFKRNLHKIEMLNKHEQGTAKYGITEFADMTEKEYLRKTGLIVPERHENELRNPIAHIPDIQDLPTEFDWRDKGVITPVKNQGNCGSCWSFSVTGNIEGLHAIKTGKLESYSEQELLDCDTTDNACNGGYMDDAFKAIEKIGGLELEEEYPYKARKQKCAYNQTLAHVKVKGVVDLPKGDEVAMQKFLISTGPISIGINANAMQFYRGGVSHPWKVLCRKSNLDHGVLIVGYGIKEYPMFNKTLPYWTIKNSWGPKWGEQGYYRVYRGDNTCGVAEMMSSAILE